MINQLSQLVALEQIADHRRAAARDHLAAAAASETRRERSLEVPSLRKSRSLLGLRKRPNLV
jgi:hypothetical protein